MVLWKACRHVGTSQVWGWAVNSVLGDPSGLRGPGWMHLILLPATMLEAPLLVLWEETSQGLWLSFPSSLSTCCSSLSTASPLQGASGSLGLEEGQLDTWKAWSSCNLYTRVTGATAMVRTFPCSSSHRLTTNCSGALVCIQNLLLLLLWASPPWQPSRRPGTREPYGLLWKPLFHKS